MKLFLIDCGDFKCDGGATFGVVPKILWQKKYPCDNDNLCSFTMRNLLIDTGERVILVDTGAGNKQSEKFFENNQVSGQERMIPSLKRAGYRAEEITDILFTHLHYDHCGGAVFFDADGMLQPTFPNATHWCTTSQWENFQNPNVREGSVYFAENMMPLIERNMVKFIDHEGDWLPGISLRIFNGHTRGLVLPLIDYQEEKWLYTGDFIPLAAQIPLAWVSAYDTSPVESMREKKQFLDEAISNGYRLIFQHDAYTLACSLKQTEKRIMMDQPLELS